MAAGLADPHFDRDRWVLPAAPSDVYGSAVDAPPAHQGPTRREIQSARRRREAEAALVAAELAESAAASTLPSTSRSELRGRARAAAAPRGAARARGITRWLPARPTVSRVARGVTG